MKFYTAWCTMGRFELNALIKARTKEAARNKMRRQLSIDYRIRSVKRVTDDLVSDYELYKEMALLAKAKANKIIIYDAGT